MSIPSWLPVTTHTLPPATATLKEWARWLADHPHAPLTFEEALRIVKRWDVTLPFYRCQLARLAWPCRNAGVLSARDVESSIFRLKSTTADVEAARRLGWLPANQRKGANE